LLNALGEQASAIGIAVVTALLTTVVVEFLAKPRLEARKARLIRDRQQIDEVIFAFQRAALTAGSVVPADAEPNGSLMKTVHQRQVLALGADLDGVSAAISRLPVRFVERHREHVAWTARFLGYAKALAVLAAEGEYITDSHVRQIADDMPAFDTYFVANVDFHDSQEPWIKRWFWKRFTARQYRDTTAQAMNARYGGTDR
jgi:hypothetical protein